MSASGEVKTAVLLVAYGGPDSLEDVEAFLLDVRGGRPTSPEFVAEVKERYRLIGGCSPLLERTTAQAEALAARLAAREGAPHVVRVAMRHWKPRVADVVRELAESGIRRVVAIPMTPYDSRYSTGAYIDKLAEAAALVTAAGGVAPEIRVARSWHQVPGLLDAFEDRIRTALGSEGADGVAVIFTAHSLPARILGSGDPYVDQLRETASTLRSRVGLADADWRFAFQSPGRTPDPWIGPFVEETLAEMAGQGWKRFLVVPIGFVCDHVEILYDVDVALQEKARELGVALARTESPNAHPSFIAALESMVDAAEGRATVPVVVEVVGS